MTREHPRGFVTSRECPMIIYTDGSCRNNPKAPEPGGWAFVIVQAPDGKAVYKSGHEKAPQTNNTMELMGVIRALEYIAAQGWAEQWVLLRPDSKYVINGASSGWFHWYAMFDFIGVPNRKLWKRLYALMTQCRRVRFKHVKGHNGDEYNELCDRMAVRARKGLAP